MSVCYDIALHLHISMGLNLIVMKFVFFIHTYVNIIKFIILKRNRQRVSKSHAIFESKTNSKSRAYWFYMLFLWNYQTHGIYCLLITAYCQSMSYVYKILNTYNIQYNILRIQYDVINTMSVLSPLLLSHVF